MRPKTYDADFSANEFLRKPIKEVALITCLREIWTRLDSRPKALNSAYAGAASGPKKATLLQVYPLKILVVEGIKQSTKKYSRREKEEKKKNRTRKEKEKEMK